MLFFLLCKCKNTFDVRKHIFALGIILGFLFVFIAQKPRYRHIFPIFYLVLEHEQFFIYQVFFETICKHFLAFEGEHTSLGRREIWSIIHLQGINPTKTGCWRGSPWGSLLPGLSDPFTWLTHRPWCVQGT